MIQGQWSKPGRKGVKSFLLTKASLKNERGQPSKIENGHLHRIAEKSRKEPLFKFTSLYHLMNEELLRECFKRLRSDSAAGIDRVTKGMYAENLDANLTDLIGRLHRMAYIRKDNGTLFKNSS